MIAQNNSGRASYLIQQYHELPCVGLVRLSIDEFPLSFSDKDSLYIIQCDISTLSLHYNCVEDFQRSVNTGLSNIDSLTLTFPLDVLSKNWSKATIRNFIEMWLQANEIHVNNLQILFI